MFVVARFTTVKMWNLPRCLSTNEGTNRTRHVRTMGQHSDIKRNGALTWAATWTSNPVRHGRGARPKGTCEGSRVYDTSRTGTSAESLGARGWGRGRGHLTGRGVSLPNDENVLELEAMVAQHCECANRS